MRMSLKRPVDYWQLFQGRGQRCAGRRLAPDWRCSEDQSRSRCAIVFESTPDDFRGKATIHKKWLNGKESIGTTILQFMHCLGIGRIRADSSSFLRYQVLVLFVLRMCNKSCLLNSDWPLRSLPVQKSSSSLRSTTGTLLRSSALVAALPISNTIW